MSLLRRLQQRWSSADFIRPVVTLASGTILAQLVAFVSIPIITRLFDAQHYGVLSIFTSWLAVMSVLATGRYEYAVLLGDARAGWYCAVLVLLLSAAVAVLVLAAGLVAAAGDFIVDKPVYALLAAVSVVSLGAYQGLYYWFNRNRRYSALARNRLYGSLVAAACAIGAGTLGYGAVGLVSASVFSQLVVALLLLWPSDLRTYPWPSARAIRELASRHRNFPKFLLVAGLLDRFSSQAHILLLAFLQGAAASGFIGLYERVVSVPQRVLSGSIGDVFKQQASAQLAAHEKCAALFIRTTKRLAILGLAPFVVLVCVGPWLFDLVFGMEWRTAGELAQVLAAKFYFGFIVSPLSSLIYIGQAQRYDLYLQIGLAISVPLGLVLGTAGGGLMGAVTGYTVVYVCKYAIEFWISWRIATGRFGKLMEPAAS